MIFGIEGISAHGKTTLIDKVLEKRPEWIRFKGVGAVNIGMGKDWQEYNFWMRNIIENLDKVNEYKKVILWDRFLTEAVYSPDFEYRKEILRVMKSHKKKAIIFINPVNELRSRITCKEGIDYVEHAEIYKEIVQSFNTLYINLDKQDDYFITDKIVDQVIEFIESNINEI